MNWKNLNWKKGLPLAGGSLVVLLVLAYFVITSSFFLCKVGLPLAGHFLKMEIKADSVKLSGLSKITVQNLKVTPNGEETILAAKEIMAELNELDTSFASFSIKEVYLDKGWVNIVQTPEGGNLAAILALMGESDTNKPPMKLTLDKLSAKDTLLNWKMIGADKSLMGAELKNVTLTGGGIGNELTGTLSLESPMMSFFMGSDFNKEPEQQLAGAFSANLKIPLTSALMPGIMSGPLKWDLPTATGMFAPFQGDNLSVDMALSLEEIQKLVFLCNKGNETLVQISADGTLDLADLGCSLNYEVSQLDYRLLNAFSQTTGIQFEKTLIGSKGTVQVADSLNTYRLKTQSQIKDLILISDTPTPVVSLESDLELSADLAKKSLSIAKLYAKGLQGQKEFLAAEITQPIVVGWGENAPEGAVDSSLHAKLNLDLTDWRTFLSDAQASGRLTGTLDADVKEKGTQVGLSTQLKLDQLKALGFQAAGDVSSKNTLALGANQNQIAGSLDIAQLNASTGSMGLTNFVLNTAYDMAISSGNVIDMKTLDIAFSQTEKAKNQIHIDGKLDLSQAPTPSSLNVFSSGLDLTPLLNWVKALSHAETTAQPVVASTDSTEPAPAPSAAASEGAQPISLPIKDFDGKIQLDALYANDVLVTNINTTLSIKNDEVAFSTGSIKITSQGSLASLEASATLSLKDLSAGVHYDISGIDEKMLNSLLASEGLQFESALFSTQGDVKASGQMTLFELKSQISAKDFKLAGQTQMPTVSLVADVDLGADLKQQILNAKELDAKGTIGKKAFLTAGLTKPLVLGWGKTAPAGSADSSLNLLLDMNMADWAGLLQDPKASGLVKGTFDLSVADSGNKVALDSKFSLSSVALLGLTASGDMMTQGSLVRSQDKNAFVGKFSAEKLSIQNDSLDITDFSVGTDYEIALSDEALDIQKLKISWKPTERAKNEVAISGNLAYADLSKPSRLKIVSESMDFTPQLSWMKSTSTSTNTADSSVQPAPVAQDPNDHSLPLPKEEPAAIDLPVKDFECDINLGAVFLKEMFLTNVNANLFVKTNVVGATTKSFNMNGGDLSASARADLNQPGYKYSLNYNAPGIPAAPIFDFLAADLPGELSSGKIFAVGSLSGAGLTESAIQKNLALQNVCGLTNVSFRPVSSTYKVALTPILTLLRISDLVDAPIVGIHADFNGTNGTFNINSAKVITDAFEADVTGTLNLEPVLMDTPLELPLTIYLEQQVADKSNLSSIRVQTNSSGFLSMPDFVKIIGTPAVPDVSINKLVITGLLLKSGTGLVGDVGSGANKIVGNVGGLLVGDTNNTNGVKGIAEGLGSLVGIKKKAGDTNTVEGTSTNSNSPSTPLGGLLNIIKRK